MVNVLCAVTAAASVNGPFTVDVAYALFARRASSALSFGEGDSFPHVLCNLLVPAEGDSGETSLSVDVRFCNPESVRKFPAPFHVSNRMVFIRTAIHLV